MKKPPKKVLKGKDIKKESNPVGRPTDYCEETVTEICVRLSCGESLRSICNDSGIPTFKTVFTWIHKYPEFLQQYTRSKEMGCEAMAEDIFDIADGNEDGKEDEDIARSRLRVDTRKWYLSKIKAKKYGERLDLAVTNNDDMTEEEIDARLKVLEDIINKTRADGTDGEEGEAGSDK
jgi:hypothetical protein